MVHDDRSQDGRLDLVPMIDCVMLLLLFFILTAHFSSPDKAIATLLPTDRGQVTADSRDPVPPPEVVRIAVYPADPTGARTDLALIRIGGHEPIPVAAADLVLADDQEALKAAVDRVAAAVGERLAAYERPGARQTQAPIEIHCWSGMPWRFGLAAYDAVRAFEERFHPPGQLTARPDPATCRAVSFAPPRIRNHAADERAHELAEIIALR